MNGTAEPPTLPVTHPAAVASRLSALRTARRPADLVVRGAFYLLVVTVTTSLWRAAALSAGGVAGYGVTAVVWYMVTSEIMLVSVPDRLIERVGDDIAGGEFAAEMLRPARPVDLRLAAEFGALLPVLAMCTTLGLACGLLIAGPPPRPALLPLVVVSLVLACAVNLAGMHLAAGLCFWLRDARSSWFLYMKLVFLLGGALLPLELLPPAVAAVARLLPFASMAYVPARLASGHWEPLLLIVQAAWLIVIVLGARAVFSAGERRLEGVGG